MKVLIAMMLIALAPAGRPAAGERFACNMLALTRSERAAYGKLADALRHAVQEQRELRDGYAFRLSPAMLVPAAEWVSYERRCCPFFSFELEQARDEGPVWLRVTGSEGVKAFIRAEFGLDGEE